MIGYLKGEIIDIVKNANNRPILLLEVAQVGYEIQIPSQFARLLSQAETKEVKVYTHLQIKEDQHILYGFNTIAERDLFRQLISVSGIGAQLAIALIDCLGIADLVQAIVTGNTKVLTKTPGVGNKTAERIALELKTKLAQWREVQGITISTNDAIPAANILEDVEMTLLALGYTNTEIQSAISTLSQDALMLKQKQPEEWIRNAIAWLSSSDNGM